LQQITFSIGKTHPSLAGHFPGNPVVPAVVLLDELLAGVAGVYPDLHIYGFKQVKFLKPVLPGERVQVRLKPSKTGMNFQAYGDGEIVFSGELSHEAMNR